MLLPSLQVVLLLLLLLLMLLLFGIGRRKEIESKLERPRKAHTDRHLMDQMERIGLAGQRRRSRCGSNERTNDR